MKVLVEAKPHSLDRSFSRLRSILATILVALNSKQKHTVDQYGFGDSADVFMTRFAGTECTALAQQGSNIARIAV